MSFPRDEIQTEMAQAWATYLAGLGKSLNIIEKEIEEAKNMASVCTGEWCEATEHVFDEIGNMLFSISEPRWTSEADSKRLKLLKRKLYDLYVNYKGVYAQMS